MTEPDREAARAAERDAVRRHLFDFRGRYGRKQFWLAALGLVVMSILLFMAAGVLMNPTGADAGQLTLIVAFAGIFLWFYSKVIIHRLHDLGWSGWWFLLLGPLMIPLPIWMMNETHAVYHRIEQSHAAQQAIKPYVASLQYGALLLFIGGFVLMGCLRGTKGPNKYGPDPNAAADAHMPAP